MYSICKIKYTFYAEDGSFVEAITIGEGMDTGDKATNKAMAIAFKYALFQVFCIPTEEMKADDPDNECHEVRPRNKKPVGKAVEELGNVEQKALEEEAALKAKVIGYINRHGLDDEKIKAICKAYKVGSLQELTAQHCSHYIKALEKNGGSIDE